MHPVRKEVFMQAYSKIVETYLKYNKPEKYERLKSERKLNRFLQDIDDEYDAQEYSIVLQVCNFLPENNEERMVKIQRARIMAREIVIIHLTDFLENME